MKKKGISIGALIIAILVISKFIRFFDAYQKTYMNNPKTTVKNTVQSPIILLKTSDDCPQNEAALYFEESNKIAEQFEYTSAATYRAYMEQLDLDYPPCLKELHSLTTNYYYYAWGATSFHEKGDTYNANFYVKLAEQAFEKMSAETNRLGAKYGWNTGDD